MTWRSVVAGGAGQAGQRPDLIDAVLVDLLFGLVQFAAAEVFAVGEAGVGAGVDAVTDGGAQGGQCVGRAAGVEAAGDVGRRDERHQLGVERAAFAEVAVEVDVHHTMRRNSRTCRPSTSSVRTAR